MHPTNSKSGCRLCGLPLRNSPQELSTESGTLSFCCRGCLHVFQILAASGNTETDFRATDLFRDCLNSGMVAGGDHAENPELLPPPTGEEVHASEMTRRIDGMWCPSCAWLVEEMLRRLPGVVSVRVDFFSDLLQVRYLPHHVGPEEISRRLDRLGYRLRSVEDPVAETGRQLLLRLGIAAILSVNIMMLSFSLYGGFFQDLGRTGINSLSLPLFLLTTPVLFYSGWPILHRGLSGLLVRRFTMDSLIAVGALAAYLYSIHQMSHHGLHLYFDTAAMLITLVLLGRFIEHRARSGPGSGIDQLQKLAGGKLRVLRHGRPQWVAASALQNDERVIVETGERLAVDGIVIRGSAEVDEAVLTGEARPVRKKEGDEVLAGSLLLHGRLHLEVSRLGAASSLGRIITMVQDALQSKNRLEKIADRLSRWFVPAVFLVAAATATLLLFRGHQPGEALLRGLTVLVISCPCALGIATPLAKLTVLGRARSRGIVVRNSAAFERVADLDTLVFDKTGTVTEGTFALRRIHSPACSEEQALSRAAAVEFGADHFLGRELRQKAALSGRLPPPASDCRLHPGMGVSGLVDGELTAVGSRALMVCLGLRLPAAMDRQALNAEIIGQTVVFLGWLGEVRAFFVFGDSIRPGMKELLEGLKAAGFDLHLLSGDSNATTARVADLLGIASHTGQCIPEDKVKRICALQKAGKKVAMIGDGINDSGALARAEVGIAVGSGPAALMDNSADVTLLPANVAERLPEVFQLSRLMNAAIRQNLAFAFLYNAIGIPLAAFGLLNPLVAVCAMFASSLTVIGNTFRLNSKTGRTPAALRGESNPAGCSLPETALPVQ